MGFFKRLALMRRRDRLDRRSRRKRGGERERVAGGSGLDAKEMMGEKVTAVLNPDDPERKEVVADAD